MPRPRADEESEARVRTLVAALFSGFDEGSESVGEIAEKAGLGYETVRSLMRGGHSRPRSGPGFFIVAAVARARRLSLDELASKVGIGAEG